MKMAKKEFPHGRSKKKMSKEKAHKQRVAMCMNAEGEKLTFKGFLLQEAEKQND